MWRSLKKILTNTILAATTSIGVFSPVLEVKATPSPGEDWDYVAEEPAPCLPQFSVDFQLPERVIAIEQRDSCPVSSQVYVHLADDKREFRLIAHQSQNFSGRWVTQVDPVAKGGLYRVMGVEYLNGSFSSPLDQRITIVVPRLSQVSSQQTQHPVAPPPPVEAAPPQQVVTTLDPEFKQLLRDFEQWSRNFDQWMRWFQVNIWPQLQPLIRAIEGIKTS